MLVFFFLEKDGFTKPFLFPHGNLKTDTLYKQGLRLDETLVYETVANPCLEDDFASVTNGFAVVPEFVVFFSPSGVQSTLDCIKRVPVDWSLLKVIFVAFEMVYFYFIVVVYCNRTSY